MPKIKITEQDLTGVINAAVISNTVYVPGVVSSGASPVAPFLVTSTGQLDEAAVAQSLDSSCLSYRLARYLLATYGMYVVYEGLAAGSTSAATASWDALRDKGLFDIRFLTTGQFGGVIQEEINCAAARGDCTALVDFTSSTTGVDAIRQEVSSIASGEYAAAFTPWFTTSNSSLVGVNETSVNIPASFGFLFAYGRACKNNPQWFAAAGSQRGIIDELSGVLKQYSSAECEQLQARAVTGEVNLDDDGDNVGVAVNPIAYVRPFGYVIWGNRTLRNNDATTGLIATSFLNIRNMVSAIKKSLYNAARQLTFEQNSDNLWINFKTLVSPLLDQMKSSEGLLDYRFVKVPTTKRARLVANLRIIPIEAVEDFDITVELTDSIEVVE